MPKTRWRFINSSKPSEVIVVHDRWSAEVLSRVLKGELLGPWSMQTEERSGEETAASRVAVPIKPAQRRGAVVPPAAPVPTPDPSVPARQSKRFNVRLYVVVVCGAQTFHSNTRDVSTGGLALEDKIPACFYGQYCRIYVYRSMDGERIDLKCRIFPDPRNPRRLQFVDPPQVAIDRLSDWALTLESSQDKPDAA